MNRLTTAAIAALCVITAAAQTRTLTPSSHMPLSDTIDRTPEFHQANARMTLRALREMTWGAILNDTLIKHFVLPLRVNNEPLDSFRLLYYDELAQRVSGLSMTQAALEVNHWCHEKMTYRPTDARTSSPLQSIRTAYGRCGEESTLCVAAMRAVAIPARQVYTPRWAHCDDNHAWVEVWTDGAWHFLGACEPEPQLDLAWFNAPASRALLMHTKVPGHYSGPEEILNRTPTYTEINLTSNYAPTRRIIVRVTDTLGQPISNARVDFCIYNYAEFYPAATLHTDSTGTTALSAGMGDMLVWASNNGRYGFQKANFATDSLLTITLSHTTTDTLSQPINIHTPPPNPYSPIVSPQARNQNEQRLAQGDSVRHAYEATMHQLPLGATPIDSLLWKSRGNHNTIRTLINQYGERAILLLHTLTDKDLRDAPLHVLQDHLQHSTTGDPRILSPRVENEPLTAWRATLSRALPQLTTAAEIRKWCNDSLQINDSLNLGGTSISPIGVLRTHQCDTRSRRIFIVSLCRAHGIPAWLDPITGAVCTAQDPHPDTTATSPAPPTGTLRLTGDATLPYNLRFTISRLNPDGTTTLLGFPEAQPLSNIPPTPLPTGTYLLTTGTRRRSGDVLAHLSTFIIQPNAPTIVTVTPRPDNDTAAIIGHIHPDTIHLQHTNTPTLIALLRQAHEPSDHAYRDISSHSQQLQDAGINIHLVFPSEPQQQKFTQNPPAPIPSATTITHDAEGTLRKAITQSLPIHNPDELPIIILLDPQGNVHHLQQGYHIGTTDTLLRIAHNLSPN